MPRFPYHSHPKRWASSCRALSISFFAYHGLKDFSKKNFYELAHSLPLRGGTSHFWREAEGVDPYKYEGRKAGKLKSRGRLIEDFHTKVKIRFIDESPSQRSNRRRKTSEEEGDPCLADSGESREEMQGHVDYKREEEMPGEQEKKMLGGEGESELEKKKKKRGWRIVQENQARSGRKQLIFTPKEIYFKVRVRVRREGGGDLNQGGGEEEESVRVHEAVFVLVFFFNVRWGGGYRLGECLYGD